jgi:hypothetical protein
MKQLTVFGVSVIFTCFSFTASSQQQVMNAGNDQPYKVQATNVTIGNPAYAQKVLWFWKYFDDNTLDKVNDLFADDVMAVFADGSTVKGKDNLMKACKTYRNSFASVSSEVAACVTLKSPDNPRIEVVSIWGVETDTAKDGTVTKVQLNEVWYFTKEGKVVQVYQMTAKFPTGMN